MEDPNQFHFPKDEAKKIFPMPALLYVASRPTHTERDRDE